jgi:predicted flap endonuclease-1-like 5' DNA nuclease
VNETPASIEPEPEDADDSEAIQLKRRGLNAPDQELPITARLIAETRAAVVASAPEGADDIEIIEGIGPRIAEALRAGGILTFQQLASATPGELERIVRAQGVRLVGNADTWPRQAQFLVDGDVEGFKAYLSRLIAGREPDEPQQP